MQSNQPIERIVRPNEARARVGVSRAKFAKMIADGHFPKPFVIIPGGRAVGWLESEVSEWIADRHSSYAGGSANVR